MFTFKAITRQVFFMLFFISSMQMLLTGCTKADKPVLSDHKLEEEPLPTPEEQVIVPGTITNLGPQVTEDVIQGSIFSTDEASGRDLLYTVVRGAPAHLLAYDLKTNQLLADLPLVGTDGSWDIVTSSDGTLYIAGSSGGFLYRYQFGNAAVENLGKVLGTENYIWDLVKGKNGEIFGATYPGCRVFRYHPNEGFRDVRNGPLVAGQLYARSLIYHERTQKIYAGIGTSARLVELDIASGATHEFLPKYRDQEFVYNMGLIEGLTGGDRLLMTIQNVAKSLVYNLETKSFETELGDIYVKTATKSPNSQTSYYTSGSKLYSWEATKSGQPSKAVANVNGNALATKWLSNGELCMLNTKGEILKFNPVTETITSVVKLAIPPQPIQINFVSLGPDGKVWTGGYLAGSNAAYDPLTRSTSQRPGLPQTESIARLGSNLYFGTYTGSRVYRYDTKQSWDLVAKNPKELGRVAGQDRPFGGLGVEDIKRVFFGTVPTYGKNGGALLDYDISTNKLNNYTNIVPNQSIVSLVYANKILFGGTSIWGGLGISPVAVEAKLFGWDPIRNIKVSEIVPVAGAKIISCLINGPDGNIWGIAGGDLFIFDPVVKSVLSRHKIFTDNSNSAIWRADMLVIHPNGNLYGSIRGQLYRINPATMEIKKLNISGVYLTMDLKGRLYFGRSLDLWRYDAE